MIPKRVTRIRQVLADTAKKHGVELRGDIAMLFARAVADDLAKIAPQPVEVEPDAILTSAQLLLLRMRAGGQDPAAIGGRVGRPKDQIVRSLDLIAERLGARPGDHAHAVALACLRRLITVEHVHVPPARRRAKPGPRSVA